LVITIPKKNMQYQRLPLFLTLWLAGFGFFPVCLPFSRVEAQSLQLIAQLTKPKSISTKNNNAYNEFMQAGYEATQQKDFLKAKKEFQKALAKRPQDIYAQQALQNIDIYSSRTNNPSSSSKTPLGLILGLVAVLAGLGAVFWLFFRNLALKPIQKPISVPNPHKVEALPSLVTHPLLPQETISSANSKANPDLIPDVEVVEDLEVIEKDNLDSDLHSGLVFPIQTTTRISSPELLETLFAQLQDPNPKTRRKAIWEIAQKADSRAMKPLVDLMIESDSHDRTLILEALSQVGTRALKPLNQALAISLQDKNPQVRKNAIRDLTRIYDVMSQISEMLNYVLEDADSEVKETAKWAIDQLNIQMPARPSLHARPPKGSVTVEQTYAESGE